MLFTTARGRQVVDAETAEIIGSVAGITLTPLPARVVGLKLKPRAGRELVAWEEVKSFGPDAVIVSPAEHAADLRSFADLPDPLGKILLTETGRQMGTVQDIDFDPRDGHVRRLLGVGADVIGECLLGIGTFAAVVSETSSPGPAQNAFRQ
ncbi:PRC-barrel domain-containing protein [Streptomyces sp. NPDC058864]